MLKISNHWDQCKELWKLIEGNDAQKDRIQICFNFINNLKGNINLIISLASLHEEKSYMKILNQRRT